MPCSALNNLWKLSGNSEHSSAHNAWNLKINVWRFGAWEMRDQNQAGFMVTSETHAKKTTPKTWSYGFQSLSKIKPGVLDMLCVNIRMYIYVFMHTHVFSHLRGEWTFLPLCEKGRNSPFWRWEHSDTEDAAVTSGQTAAGESQALYPGLCADCCVSTEGLSSAERGYSLQTEPSSIC